MVNKKSTLKLRLNAYASKNKGIDFVFEHCGTEMIGVPQKQPHWNCDPVKWQCPICGFILKTDASHYDTPRPKHIGFEMEVDIKQKENKILKCVEKTHLSNLKFE